ncbi:MAG: hypothetical protein Q8N18_12830 [Opitutaceae bacterium]|nr:hypothetical protein [Opitutaceae bacterium]
MRRRFVFLLGFVLLAALLRAASPLDNARRAQALLGEGFWSQLIEVENTADRGRYPAVLHALVFEFAGLLWFYTDADGTQSFSTHRNNLVAEKADFAPLLRDIHPGFRRWRVLPSTAGAPLVATGPLQNGCFIESLAAVRARAAAGRPLQMPRLLSYYMNEDGARIGHTVLAYESGDRVEIFDPGRPEARLSFPRGSAGEPLALARALEGRPIDRALFLGVEFAALTEQGV